MINVLESGAIVLNAPGWSVTRRNAGHRPALSSENLSQRRCCIEIVAFANQKI